MNRDGYRDQIVTCDVDVSAFQDTYIVHEVQQCTSTVLCISLSELVFCAFSTIPIIILRPFLIQRIFHSLVAIEIYTAPRVQHFSAFH